ncbi:t-SNARE [Linnemannia elongata]|nr:t-SNARE [Linnemannia elongata]KAK5827218.1 t-SNARE [Linnemannia elongata]
MSFADLERGEGGFRRTGGSGPSPLGGGNGNGDNGNNNNNGGGSNNRWNPSGNPGDAQAAFSAKANQISQQIFRISSDVSSIHRLVEFLGTNKDTEDVRNKLHDVTEQTRLRVKETSQEIKDLARLDNTHVKKLEHNKLSKDFQKVLVEFQKVQRTSAEKQREFVDRARHGATRNDYSDEDASESGDRPLIDDSQRRMQLIVVDNELEYNESMIVQREEEIREIESGITELNEIFRDLGTMVHEQGSMLDSIENNVTSISMSTHAAAEELTTAAIHQRNARKKSCYLLLIVAFVAGIVAVAVLS